MLFLKKNITNSCTVKKLWQPNIIPWWSLTHINIKNETFPNGWKKYINYACPNGCKIKIKINYKCGFKFFYVV